MADGLQNLCSLSYHITLFLIRQEVPDQGSLKVKVEGIRVP